MIEQITVNEFVDVKDIKGMFLYTKSNKIFSYLRIYPFNLDLLTTEDRRNLTNRLAAAFDGDRKNFMYCTLPRELDLDGYKIFLKEKRQAAETLGKKRIIDELIKKATDLTSSTENYEHQHFYKFWVNVNDATTSQAEIELRDRTMRFRDMYRDVQIPCEILEEREITHFNNFSFFQYFTWDMYRDVQIPCEILEEREIIKMCNLYSNRRSNSYDVNLTYSLEIPFIRG